MSSRALNLMLGLMTAMFAVVTTAGAQSLALETGVSTTTVEFGRAFDLEVVSRWTTGFTPAPIDESCFAPLHVGDHLTSRRDIDGGIEEVRRYRVSAFVLGEVVLDRLTRAFHLEGDETPITVTAAALRLDVGSSLPPADDGRIEGIGGLEDEPARRSPWKLAMFVGLIVVAATAIWFGACVVRRLRRPTATERALARLALAGESFRRGEQDGARVLGSTGAILGEFVAAHTGAAPHRLTAVEFAASSDVAARLGASGHRRAADVLSALERAAYDRAVPAATFVESVLTETRETIVAIGEPDDRRGGGAS